MLYISSTMRWTPGGVSNDVEDRRGSSGFRLGGGMPMGIGGAVVLLILSLVFGKNFFALLDGGGGETQPAGQTQPVNETPAERQQVEFISDVLDDAQGTWDTLLPQQQGAAYRRAKLVLFRESIETACGFGRAAAGPFYCPSDEKVYIDLAFYDDLKSRFGADGDFAQAYVLGHEIGHHVQNVLGIAPKVHQAMQNDPSNARALSVRLELQADCLAGVWANSASKRNVLEAGDVEEGLGAAAAVGDDRIQKMSGRAVNPESFTHGSARERMDWFQRGHNSGRIADCDTFSR